MSAKSVSVKTFSVMAAIAAALAASLLCGVPQAHAASYSYVERHWNGARVDQVTKTANCFVVDDDTSVLEDGAWYVVNSRVDSDERLIVKGTANIILCDGARLYLKDGINVPVGKTLNIYGQSGGSGELYCDADTNDNAAIGADDEKGECGAINIHGGKITADTKNKGTDGAGIGGGDEGNGGNVTIYGGEVTAIGAGLGAGIGGGDQDGGKGGNNGTTRIYGGTVNATGGSSGAGIGGGELGSGGTVEIYGGNVTAHGGSDAAGIGGGVKGSGGTVEIYGGTVNATGGSANSNGGAGIGGGGAGSSGTIKIHDGNVTAKGGANAAGIGGGDEGGAGEIEITGGTVNATGGSVNYDGGAGIGGGNGKGGGTVTIRGGAVTAQGGCDAAGIGGGDDGAGGTVYVINGTVNATGGKYGAGIGAGQHYSGGTIRIQGGTVIAAGGSYGAGLGGGQRGNGGSITITDGTVMATGGTDSAGIGAGEDGNGGSINITRGNVTANGGVGGAGIGGGDGVGATNAGNSGAIDISGGEVTATGGAKGAGIGGGNSGDSGNSGIIAISGGKVTATGGGESADDENPKGAAGIGGGNAQTGGTINITGGEVTARASYRSAGIGGGGEASGGNITISGGTVKAYGGAQGKNYRYIYPEGGAGIGGGYKNDGGTITIEGNASVVARGTEGAAGIGGGRQGKSGTIVINGGTVDASTGHGGAGIGSGFICRDSGTTVNVTINGGTVKAVGGKSLLQTDSEVGKYFWSHPGAGIGAGGCADYMNRDDREYHSYFTGSINLNGGTIDAFVGENELGLSNAVIGGIELGDTAAITVKGGCTVKVHQNGTKNPGKALLKAKEVKLDADDKSSCVRNLTNPSDIALTNDRVAWCQRENTSLELLIEPCKHESASYTHNDETHSMSCPHCTRSYNEPHTFGEPEWTWTNGYQSATVKIACACGYESTATATVTRSQSSGDATAGTQDTITAKATIGGTEYTKVVVGPQAKVATSPRAGELTYDGRDRALVTGGSASAGTMQYKLGDSGTTEPTGEWSKAVPTGKNAGTYYVWYRCYLSKDGLESSTVPQCVTATIAKAPSPVKVAENATVKVNGGFIKLEDYVKMNGAAGTVAFSDQGARDAGCSITSDSDGTYFTAGTEVPENSVPVAVTVAADDNYEALAATDINVKVTSDTVLIVSADDVTTDYVEGGHVYIPNVKVLTEDGVEPAGDYGGIIYPTDPPFGNEYLRSASDLSNDLTILKAGTTYVTVSAGGRGGYAFAYKDVKVTINKASITPVVSLSGWTYGDTAKAPALSDGSNPGEGAVTYEYKAAGAGDDAYTTTVPDQAGSYVVRATVAETDNYLGATSAPVEFAIAKADASGTPSAIEGLVYSGEPQALVTADAAEGGTMFYQLGESADTAPTGEWSEAVPTATAVGTYYVWYKVEGDANHNNIAPRCITAPIATRKVIVTADDRSSIYGTATLPLAYRITEGSLASADSIESLGIGISCEATSSSAAGQYPITLSIPEDQGNPNYEVTLVNGAYTITNATLSVTAAGYSETYDGKPHGITVNVEPADTGAVVYYATEELTADNYIEKGKTEPVTLTGACSVSVFYFVVAPNYDPAVGHQAVMVRRALSAVTRAPSPATGLVYDGGRHDLVAAGAAEGGVLEYRVGGGEWSANVSEGVEAGAYTVDYRVTGDANHEGVPPQSVACSIARANIAKARVVPEPASYVYDGKAKQPAAQWVVLDGRALAAGTDYDVSYANNVNVGTATLTVTGKGNYAGIARATFTIKAPAGKTVDMHRLYNPNSGEHFYTASTAERDGLVALGWAYEGVGWIAPSASNSPVFRLYNPYAGDHHYTMSEFERNWLVRQGWRYEGYGWYSDDAKAVPVYRQYNPNAVSGAHNYTINKAENDLLTSLGWHAEGVGWYGVNPTTGSALSAAKPASL